MSKTNILSINYTDGRGGAAQIAFGIASSLDNAKFRSSMLVCRAQRDVEWIKQIPLAGHEWDEVRKSIYMGIPNCLLKSSFLIPETKEFRDANVIHLHNLHPHYFNKFALPYMSLMKPLVWTLHDMEALTGHCCHSFDCNNFETGCKQCPNLSISIPLIRDTANEIWKDNHILYSMLDADIVVPSEWLKNIVERSILKHLPTHVIPNGINTNIFRQRDKTEARREFNLPPDSVVLGFTAEEGLCNPWKGGHILIEALLCLAKKFTNLVLFNIGGEIELPGLPIVSVPYIHDKNMLARAYSAADIFAYPTLAETFGLVVVEALACGLPVVSFRTGGVPEVLADGETGFLVRYGDTQGFISALSALIKSKLLQNQFSLRGKEVARKFDMPAMVNAYEQLYNLALDTRHERVLKLRDRFAKSKSKLKYISDKMNRIGNSVAGCAYEKLNNANLMSKS